MSVRLWKSGWHKQLKRKKDYFFSTAPKISIPILLLHWFWTGNEIKHHGSRQIWWGSYLALGRKEDRVRNRPETGAKVYLSKAYIWYLISSGLLPEHPKIVPLVGYQVFNTGPIGIISYSNSDLAKVFFFLPRILWCKLRKEIEIL